MMAMTYGNVYVASVAMGAKDEHTLRAFLEAEAYEGVSIIIAYSHCIAHGIEMTDALRNQKALVDSGQWLLYRYNPLLELKGENPLKLDSRAPKLATTDYLHMENRFKQLEKLNPDEAKKLFAEIEDDIMTRWHMYEYLSTRSYKKPVVTES
jgi:pyruvate-ferredoxin/flavodoxin oxidoreductase